MPPLRHAVDHLRRLVRPRPISDTDRALLAAFAATRDEAAFAELVRRHGPLVNGVCRRVLGRDPVVDDAFQATFLLLARKAGSGGWRDSVAGWLHAAAWHIAQKARRAANRRLRFAVSADLATLTLRRSPDPLNAAAWRELFQVFDEELARLPERLRAPLVLCFLECRTRDEAAATLGLPLGAFKYRLARARAVLRNRLTRRGVTLAVAGLPAALTGESVSAASAADVARLAAGYVCGEAVVESVAELLRSGTTFGGAKTALMASVVVLAGIIAGVASRERERPVGGNEQPPVARAPGSPVIPRDPLPPGAVARLGTLAFCHGLPVQQLLTSPDGRSIITIGGPVRIWDAATGREEGSIPAPEGQLFFAGSLLPGGEQLALSGFDGSIRIWDWKTRREVRSFKPELDGGKAIGAGSYVFDPTGRLAVLTNHNGSAPVVDLATGKVTQEPPGKPDHALSATFTADGKTVITAESGEPLRFWDVATGKEQRQIASPILNVSALAVSPDGRWLAVAGISVRTVPAPGGGTSNITDADKNVHVVDLTTGRDMHHFDTKASTPGTPNPTLLFTPDSRFLLTGARDVNGQYVRQWDLATGKQAREFATPGSEALGGGAPALALSRDGQTLLTADTVVRLWDWQTGKEKREPSENPGRVTALVFLPDGRALVTGGSGLVVWDVGTGRQLRRMAEPSAQVDGFAVAPDGRTLAVVSRAGDSGQLAVFDPATGRPIRETKASDGYLYGPIFAPDGKSLVTASSSTSAGDSTIRLWDSATLTQLWTKKLRAGGGLSFSPDGRTLRGIMAGFAGQIALFSIDTGTGKLTEHGGLGWKNQWMTFSWSPDGRFLAAAGWQGNLSSLATQTDRAQIYVFDAATGKPVREFTGVRFVPFQIAYSPDGKWLAAGDWNGVVTIWDTAAGKQVREFPGHRGQVTSLAYSPDGKRLASASIDTTVLIWDVSDLRPAGP
jgi:RNA polymerase sigma factor (sigma-70 family)